MTSDRVGYSESQGSNFVPFHRQKDGKMKKHVLIAGLMGATVLGSVPPASAAPPERSASRSNDSGRSTQQMPRRESRANRSVSREQIRSPQVERSSPQIRQTQVSGTRQESRDWRQVSRENRFEQQQQNRNDRQPSVNQGQRNDRQNWHQDGRNDRQDWRQNNRDERRDWRQGNRNDRQDTRRNDRDNRRDWRNDTRYRNDPNLRRPAPRYNWNQDWRRNQRYDWQRYRDRYHDRYRYNYAAPRGWSYGYRRFSIGIAIWSGLYSSRYWINDPYYYRLPPVYGSLRWVRYYDDALLIDTRSGYVVDVIYDFFW